MKKTENKYELKHKKFASKNYTYTSKLSIYFSCKPMLSFFKRNVCVWGVKCIEHKIGKGWSDLLIKSIAEKWKNVAINCYKCRLLVAQLPTYLKLTFFFNIPSHEKFLLAAPFEKNSNIHQFLGFVENMHFTKLHFFLYLAHCENADIRWLREFCRKNLFSAFHCLEKVLTQPMWY